MSNPTCFVSNFFRETILSVVTQLGVFVKSTDTELQVVLVLALLFAEWSTLIGRAPSRLVSYWVVGIIMSLKGSFGCFELCLYGIGIWVASINGKDLLLAPCCHKDTVKCKKCPGRGVCHESESCLYGIRELLFCVSSNMLVSDSD